MVMEVDGNMPISKINQDGTVEIYNTKTGQRKNVKPQELGQYSPSLVKEYSDYSKANESITGGSQNPELTGAAATDVNFLKDIYTSAQEVTSKYKPEHTGLLDSILGKGKVALNLPGGREKASFNSAIADIRTAVRKYISGAAISPAESKEFIDLIPKDTDSDTQFAAKVDALQKRSLRKGQNVLSTAGFPKVDPEQYFGSKATSIPQEGLGNRSVGNVLGLLFPNIKNMGQNVMNLPKTAGMIGEEIKQKGAFGAPSKELLSSATAGGEEGLLKYTGNRGVDAGIAALKGSYSQKGAAREIVEPILGLLGIKSGGKFLLDKLKTKAPAVAEDVLQEGLNLAQKGGTVRNVAIEKATQIGETVDGTVWANRIKDWGRKAIATGEDAKKVNQLVKQGIQQFDGKVFSPEQAKGIWDAASKGYKSNKINNTLLGSFQREIRDGVRGGLEKVAPGFEEGTAKIAEGLGKEKILKSVRETLLKTDIKNKIKPPEGTLSKILKGSAKTGVTAATTIGLMKLLGIGGQGGFGGE